MKGPITFAPMLIDHYAILGLPPSASVSEIKSAYRSMARQHHPDLNPQDPGAIDRFRAIHTAYQTLTHPSLKQAYLEKRWYAQHQHQSLQSKALSFEQLLKQLVELERFVATLDPHRMDRNGLHQHLLQCIELLKQVNIDSFCQQQEIESSLRLIVACSEPLTFVQAKSIHERLYPWLNKLDRSELLSIAWLTKKKNQETWQRWTPWIVFALTTLITVWIWKSA